MLKQEIIFSNLKEKYRNIDIFLHEALDSTNLESKRLIQGGCAKHGSLIAAGSQTKGRGRLGRTFYSPEESGIYMSIILKAKSDFAETVLITAAASVAVCRAIKNVFNEDCNIKWVNDIYLNQKKICGILAEGFTDPNTGALQYIILGIGINCSMPKNGFPTDLKNKAGALSLSCSEKSKNLLIAEVVNQTLDIYETLSDRLFIEEYKKRSNVIGRYISVIKNYPDRQYESKKISTAENHKNASLPNLSFFNQEANTIGIPAFAADIDLNGGLLVEYSDGTSEVLNTGEISIRF